MSILDDDEIQRLISLEKRVANPRARRLEQKGSERITYDAEASAGEKFKIYVRQNQRILEAFSCGIIFISESGEQFTLIRYNGSDHEHSNPLEDGKPLPMACHIHVATRRYMEAGRKAEHYAETTDRYSDCAGALRALISDCNVQGLGDNEPPIEDSAQARLDL